MAAQTREAELEVGAALRGFGTGIDFQQTEAVERAGRQAAGVCCQGLCSYFQLLKLEPGPFSVSSKDTLLFRLKGNNRAAVARGGGWRNQAETLH